MYQYMGLFNYAHYKNRLYMTNIFCLGQFVNVKMIIVIHTFCNHFQQPYYYLRNGDVLYVEPSKAKATFTDRSVQLVPIITSVATAIIVFLNVILK